MQKTWQWFKKNWVIWLVILILLATWIASTSYRWSWSDFWSNFFSNAGSSAVIGVVLYLIITRPDEKNAAEKQRAQALAMLKFEFTINLERAKQYGEALQYPENDLSPYYPLQFTRGAWNALKESGFLPQIEDVSLVYELLHVNEIVTIANSSLTSVRSSKANDKKVKLNLYAKKAVKECAQIVKYLNPILLKLEKMNLPKVELLETAIENDILDDNDEVEGEETN